MFATFFAVFLIPQYLSHSSPMLNNTMTNTMTIQLWLIEYLQFWKARFLAEMHIKEDDPRIAVVEKFMLFACGWGAAICLAFSFYRYVLACFFYEGTPCTLMACCSFQCNPPPSHHHHRAGGGNASTGPYGKAIWMHWMLVPRSDHSRGRSRQCAGPLQRSSSKRYDGSPRMRARS